MDRTCFRAYKFDQLVGLESAYSGGTLFVLIDVEDSLMLALMSCAINSGGNDQNGIFRGEMF